MPSPYKKGRQACKKLHSNREVVVVSRQHSDICTWCPPNGGENAKKCSQWGKKRAMKRAYTTGKKRKQWFDFLNKPSSHRYAPQHYDKGVRENLYKKNK